MTQISSLLSPSVPQLDPVPSFSPSTPNTVAPTSSAGAGGIKCICGFQDDDGSKYVYCENCDTWQHVDCYYPEKAWSEDDVHNCVHCEPRLLDAKRATEQQKRRREELDGGDRRKPRPPTKSHKKKSKEPTIDTIVPVQANGCSPSDKVDASAHGPDRHQSISRDLPPAKRPKTSHRSSPSVSSQADKVSALAPAETHRRVKSHVKSANHAIVAPPTVESAPPNDDGHEQYSLEFMRLHREDFGDSPLKANLLSNINFTSTFSSWIADPEALAEATNGRKPAEVFQRVAGSFDALEVPKISRRTRVDRSMTCHGQNPIWQYLIVESPIFSGGLVGEVKGEVGHLQDYWQDSNNRSTLRHPEPFVFFHPQLPIYIDTRREGTTCRYVRRSCRPNVEMRTLISDGNECHFCFCATQNLGPGEEVTIGWEADPEVWNLIHRGLNDTERSGVKAEPLIRSESEYVSTWTEQILANFGGCACENAKECMLAQFDHRRASTPADSLKVVAKAKKVKKGKQQISPLSTGQATNSRAGSEGVTARDREEDDSPSTTGSGRSRPRSRDVTPSTHVSGEQAASSATAPAMSDREKRKIAALERTFEQIEHESQQAKGQAPKKPKRNSSGSHPNNATAAPSTVREQTDGSLPVPERLVDDHRSPRQKSTTMSQPSTPDTSHRSDLVLAGNSRKLTASPTTAHGPFATHAGSPMAAAVRRVSQASASSTNRPTYVDSSMQTDPEPDPVGTEIRLRTPKKAFIPLTKRLLMRCHQERTRHEERLRSPQSELCESPAREVTHEAAAMALDAPPLIDEVETSQDTIMLDADAIGVRETVQITSDLTMESLNASSHSHDLVDKSASPHTPAVSPRSIKPPPPRFNHRLTSPPGSADSIPRANGHHRQADLHVQLPATPTFPTAMTSPSTPSTTTATPTLIEGVAQPSPGRLSLTTTFSPSVINSIAQPSPIKKKLSLSDYSRRKKAETPTATANAEKQLGGNATSTPADAKPTPTAEESKGLASMEATAAVSSLLRREESTSVREGASGVS